METPSVERFAIYLTPTQGSVLAREAAQWIGRDAWTGKDCVQPICPQITKAAFFEATEAPRKYGFHATLVAPFELQSGCSKQALVAALTELASTQDAFELTLSVRSLGSFLALMASETEVVNELAEAAVKGVHPLIAPLSPFDLERRKHPRLTSRQLQHVDRWGYAFVMQDYLFHMTLSGTMDPEGLNALSSCAKTWFGEALSEPFRISGLALFHQTDRETPFLIDSYVPFAAS